MADQRRIDLKISGKPEEEAWIQVINGKRANASGGFVKTKADLLKMKKYMGMVTQKVRDAYNKRLAELSKSKSADSIDAIAEKYGHEVKQTDSSKVCFDREKEKAAYMAGVEGRRKTSDYLETLRTTIIRAMNNLIDRVESKSLDYKKGMAIGKKLEAIIKQM